jgi:hypothetical protein
VIASVVGGTAQTRPGRLLTNVEHGNNFSHAKSGLPSRVNIPPT